MDGEPFAEHVVTVKRSRRRLSRFFARVALATAVGPVALMLVSAVLSIFHLHILGSYMLPALLGSWLIGTPIATFVAAVAGTRRPCAASLDVDAEAVRFHDSAIDAIPRREIVGALHVAGAGQHVEIALAGGDMLHVELATAAAARALVAALGFGASEQRTVVQVDGDHGALAAGCWGVVFGVCATLVAIFIVAMTAILSPLATHVFHIVDDYLVGIVFVAASLLFARLLRPKHVVLGTDGVVVERAFGRRFLPLADIGDIAVSRNGITITMPRGAGAGETSLMLGTEERARALRDRIQEAMANARRAEADASAALLSRGSRSLAEWREAMRKLVTSSGYRGESVSVDALLRTAERTDAPADQRIGAALAIGLTDDATAKQRLRIAASGIAHDAMRAAMNHAAEGAEDEAAIEEALAAEKKAAAR
ncbi:Hypothetical protein A7982_10339 [Minicystis rosea]|nr:Hypothetical protein A7982_10339 [Minicystis rosea]